MKQFFAITLFAILTISATLSAKGAFEFELSPLVIFNSGTTDYTIKYATLEVSVDGLDTTLIGGRSKLEFPLDATLAGLDFEARSKSATGKDITFNTSVVIDVTDPSEKMLDSDWWFDPNGYESFKWSFTESRTRIKFLLLKLEAAMSIVQGAKAQLAVMAGFHYNRMEFDMLGFDGWQIGGDGLAHDISGNPNRTSLTYEATYKLPQAGVRLTVTPSWQTRFAAQLAVGRLMASDLDDHVLRGKTAEASTTGWAFLSRAYGRLLLTQHGAVRPFLSLQFEYSQQSASGSQTQKWYRDETYYDPNTGEQQIIRKGTSIGGIGYETKTHQLRFVFGFGVAF